MSTSPPTHSTQLPHPANPASPADPTLPGALVALGPAVVDCAAAAAEVGRSESCVAPIRHAASIGDRAFFSPLPPMLLHDDYRASANVLYGRPTRLPDAGYRAGAFAKCAQRGRSYLGAALFDLNGAVYPALLYHTSTFRSNASAAVCHVYGAPLAELEARLFERGGTQPSALETCWLGDASARNVFAARQCLGESARAAGIGATPKMLLDGNYHLVRGVLPWLHLRAPKTDHESEVLRSLLAATLALDDESCLVDGARLARASVGHLPADVVATVFDRTSVDTTSTTRPSEAVERQIDAALSDSGRRNFMVRLALYLLLPTTDGAGVDLDLDDLAQRCPISPLEEASEMAKAAPPKTLLTLTAKVASVGAVSPKRLGSAETLDSVEKVVRATFAPSDVTSALCGLGATNALDACKAVAGRVQEPNAMMVIEIDDDNQVHNTTVINATHTFPIAEFDEAVRLVACPWVSVVIYSTVGGGKAWFRLDTSHVRRNELRVAGAVCEMVAARCQKGASATPPSTATPADERVARMGKEVMERVDRLSEQVTRQHASLTSAIKAVATKGAGPGASSSQPAESHTTLSLRASALTLERFTGKKRAASKT